MEEIDALPEAAKRFVAKRSGARGYDGTWEYFVGAYGLAFDRLSSGIRGDWGNGQLAAPILYLCRHSVELSIKHAIMALSGTDVPVGGHNLSRLWQDLVAQIRATGWEYPDDWGVHCEALVAQLDEIDPDGERFRYPTGRKGNLFEASEVGVKELAVAHWHIGLYCESCIDMHHDIVLNPS